MAACRPPIPPLGCLFSFFLSLDRKISSLQDPARAGGDPVLLPPLVWRVRCIYLFMGIGPPRAAWRGAVVHPSGGPSCVKSAKIQPSQQHCERRGVTLAQSAQRVARFRLKFASPLAASRRRSMTKRKTELRPNCETIAIGVGLKDLPIIMVATKKTSKPWEPSPYYFTTEGQKSLGTAKSLLIANPVSSSPTGMFVRATHTHTHKVWHVARNLIY